ncbi:MAG: hypothetical protein CK431_04385 [Mycobacterium sp.]|nr:MAG: hypothetical protein CK431_04385 [Mycobacterium sp.]
MGFYGCPKHGTDCYKTVNAVVIVPWRDKGDPWRRRNLDLVLEHLYGITDDVVACCDGRTGSAPFNRSAAYNRGVAMYPNADVYVFHEADMLLGRQNLQAAIDIAAAQPGLVVPFDAYHYLSQADTAGVHAGQNPSTAVAECIMANGRSNGAVNVVSAATMAAVGQYDETFEGWGFDDRAMAHAFAAATGNDTRYIRGSAIHLWHTPGWSADSRFRGGADIPEHEHRATLANEARYQLYRKATTPERVRDLTAGGR